MVKVFTKSGYEIWTKHDRLADVWEIFLSEDGDDYIGCADSLREAREMGKAWIKEMGWGF